MTGPLSTRVLSGGSQLKGCLPVRRMRSGCRQIHLRERQWSRRASECTLLIHFSHSKTYPQCSVLDSKDANGSVQKQNASMQCSPAAALNPTSSLVWCLQVSVIHSQRFVMSFRNGKFCQLLRLVLLLLILQVCLFQVGRRRDARAAVSSRVKL